MSIISRLKRSCRRSHISYGLLLAALNVLYEVLFQYWVDPSVQFAALFGPVLFAAGIGLLLGFAVELLPEKGQRWSLGILGFLMTTVYLVEFFVYDAYHMFMTPAMIFRGAKGVATDYADIVIGLLTRDLWRIALMLVPPVWAAVMNSPVSRDSMRRKYMIGASAVLLLLANTAALVHGGNAVFNLGHNFEGAIRSLGMPVAVMQNLVSDFGGAQQEMTLISVPEYIPETQPTEPAPVEDTDAEEKTTEPESETEPEIVYEPNVLPIDFAELAKQYSYNREINEYVAAQKPTYQNEYTGIFKGKNLILITAEAFTKEVIDPELTPTLYRLATQGIEFTDYYQPAWGGSTTGGEMSNLFGLVPDCSGGMSQIIQQRPFITMGYQLTDNEGYYSSFYHNNTGTFYDRCVTHRSLGYTDFLTPDEGMKVTGRWPQSDLEMMLDTIPRYIDKQPFNIYYMTVSGHSVYELDSHAMARKNYDLVKDLDYSEQVKCYLAANLEFEFAMEELVRRLEEAGIADDTVIVISPDHYPYGLDASRTWGNNQNCLAELFGLEELNDITRDHSALIIWSGCLEGKNIKVDSPTYSLDILPTLCNLFGLSFDSRMFVGRDVFSDKEPLVLWPNHNWITERGSYLSATQQFTPKNGEAVDEAYIEWVTANVINKINYSYAVQRQGYLLTIRSMLEKQS